MNGESLYDQDLSQATAFVMGNEGTGLREKTIAGCTKRISIPMHQSNDLAVESLNAAAATAICLFERKRQCS
jgi:TrmH family RNA methyltransferase